jgi:hypothetical protein
MEKVANFRFTPKKEGVSHSSLCSLWHSIFETGAYFLQGLALLAGCLPPALPLCCLSLCFISSSTFCTSYSIIHKGVSKLFYVALFCMLNFLF